MERINQKFEDFKLNNDLDEYFAKSLNAETRATTLSLIKDVLSQDKGQWDWLETLSEYKEELD